MSFFTGLCKSGINERGDVFLTSLLQQMVRAGSRVNTHITLIRIPFTMTHPISGPTPNLITIRDTKPIAAVIPDAMIEVAARFIARTIACFSSIPSRHFLFTEMSQKENIIGPLSAAFFRIRCDIIIKLLFAFRKGVHLFTVLHV